jgi:CRISPR-associated endonuclease/helicase Cas3
MRIYPAHIYTNDIEADKVQTVQEHCKGTAKIAGRTLKFIGLENTAYLSGLLHDMGKFTNEFSEYLEAVVHGESPKSHPIHSFTGLRYVLQHWHVSNDGDYVIPITAELIAYAIGAHHGLFDCIDEDGKNGFDHRLIKEISYDEAVANYLVQCASAEELETLFAKSSKETSVVFDKIIHMCVDGDDQYFYLGMLARLLLSATINGDRRDTAAFMTGQVSEEYPTDMSKIWNICLSNVELELSKFSSASNIDKARKAISQKCREFAEKPGDIYRLNMPTGAGKTLSSLRYALAHSAKWNKSRIIFTAPLLSILDQNAEVIRKYVNNNSIITEVHSNITKDSWNSPEEENMHSLAAEDFSSPIIITTLVQLLDILFSGKSNSIRRMQALVNSVIVIDEVQTVPTRMLSLFNMSINFLAKVCGATIILCSATQPCLESTAHPIECSMEDLVPYDEQLWCCFRRTVLTNAGGRKLEEIPDFVFQLMDNIQSLLIVCNKKNESEYLYRELSQGQYECFHLSAAMCMAHRKDTLAKLKEALERAKAGKTKLICIATQVIEAGVDISFGCVVRLSAGIDNIVQAAGRCNRNGESIKAVPVYIIDCVDERLTNLQDIQRAKDATTSLLINYKDSPQRFDNDLASDKSVKFYYQRLYKEMAEDAQDYPIPEKPTLLSLLSFPSEYLKNDSKYALNQAFKEAGNQFKVFDDSCEDVLVPWGDGEKIIADLGSDKAKHDLNYMKACLEKAKLYTISIREYQKKQLANALYTICNGSVYVLQDGFYDENTGLVTENQSTSFLEV